MSNTTEILSKEQAYERANLMVRSGQWVAFPEIDQRHAVLGIKLWGVRRGEEEPPYVSLLWPRFGKPLEAVVKKVGVAELARFFLAGNVESADDQKRGMIGFVRYDLEKGMAFVNECPVTRLRRREDAEEAGPLFYSKICSLSTRSPEHVLLRDAHNTEVFGRFPLPD